MLFSVPSHNYLLFVNAVICLYVDGMFNYAFSTLYFTAINDRDTNEFRIETVWSKMVAAARDFQLNVVTI